MKTRVITAAVLLAVFVPILFFSEYVFYPIAIAILCAVGAYELFRCLGVLRDLVVSVPGMALAACLPFFAYYGRDAATYLLMIACIFFVYLLYLLAVVVFRAGALPFGTATAVFAGGFYLTFAFSAMVLLRYIENGTYWFLLPFVGAWITDTFAYFTGYLFGKHKLAPIVSPKKTIEGSVGGIVFCILAFLLYGLILGGEDVTPNYPALAVCALAVSLVSQIGDLALSAIKREHGIKDYGKIFPGHGGVLDRFDSVIATAPLILFLYLLDSGFYLFY